MNLPAKCEFCGKALGMSDQVAMIDPETAEQLESKGVLKRPRQRGLTFWKSTVLPPSFQLPHGGKRYVACTGCLPAHAAQAALGS